MYMCTKYMYAHKNVILKLVSYILPNIEMSFSSKQNIWPIKWWHQIQNVNFLMCKDFQQAVSTYYIIKQSSWRWY